MSEKKDRELSEKELEKAAGGGQPFGTEPSKDTKSPYGSDPGTPPFGTEDKPLDDADPRSKKG